MSDIRTGGDGLERVMLPYASSAYAPAVIKSIGVDPRAPRLATALLHELHWGCRAEVDYIALDQWMGVSVRRWGEPMTRYYVECDEFEAGLASVIRRIHDDGLNEAW